MKKGLAFSALVVPVLLVGCGVRSIPVVGSSGSEGLTISAQGEAQAGPDQIKVAFSLGSLKTTSDEALVALEDKHKAVIEALAATGLGADDLKMIGYKLTTERRWDEPSLRQVVVGFRANKDFGLDLNFSEETVQKVYRALAVIPSDDTTFFSFSVSFALKNPEALQQRALANAIEKAKADAIFFAQTAGVRLGAITSIQSDQVQSRPTMYNMKSAELDAVPMAVGAMSDSAPVNVQDIKAVRNVMLVWSLARH